ncbi:MerR family transcriptional regulator [Panacibacter ginsenosidivorans]|uniref:MerR family transcriptional regulator n=1 Tax=Panacibacter ginsenosidivorans TaxID=1813871 RepID=A0A5B8V4H5_9BACT|nr:MerR family transcriptional regulator [Panacibacter ginsenosidivorans]QEC66280.1 MerR family transcriptional regulator [Panacibacter ginsenosidivorans]
MPETYKQTFNYLFNNKIIHVIFFQNDLYLHLMERFTINDIENLTGIKAHTLRIWEKRYNFYNPKRKESNHRYYDNNDLKYILKVAYLYHIGYKISKITKLNNEEINKLTSYKEANGHVEQLFINRLLQHAFEFNNIEFENTLNEAIEMLGFEKCILKVVYSYFEKVGMLWMNDIAVPAQEHFSSNIIRNKIILAIDKLRSSHTTAAPILLFTPEGEYHEIPLLFTSYLLKKYSKPFIYYGINASIKELELFVIQKKADILFFHLITNFTKQPVSDYLLLLSDRFPGKKIIMSGPLACKIEETPDNSHLLTSMAHLLNFAKHGLPN